MGRNDYRLIRRDEAKVLAEPVHIDHVCPGRRTLAYKLRKPRSQVAF